jgi:hypothetical protein
MRACRNFGEEVKIVRLLWKGGRGVKLLSDFLVPEGSKDPKKGPTTFKRKKN